MYKLKEVAHEKREELHEKREDLSQRSHQEVRIGSKTFQKGDLVRFGGLIAFFVLMIAICACVFPYISYLFEEGGVKRVISEVRSAGPLGVFMLLGMQVLQVIVAFIPGEVTQLAAGMMYGAFFGALIVLVGCIISSAFVFTLVHKLGAPFVRSMVSTKMLDRFHSYDESGKLTKVVFVLFLIPGLPKDVFTYLVPLTSMSMRDFLVVSNVGRIPGIVVSTYAAAGLIGGQIWKSATVFLITAVVAMLGILSKDKLMDKLGHAPKASTDDVPVSTPPKGGGHGPSASKDDASAPVSQEDASTSTSSISNTSAPVSQKDNVPTPSLSKDAPTSAPPKDGTC